MVPAGAVMKPVVAVVGPTAVGKTAVGIAIARAFSGEVVSGDAFQFYRGLDIGTAKVRPEETGGIPHHLIDILAPEDPFSVSDYQKIVRAGISELHGRGVLPVLVGGSGLYVQAALFDYRFAGKGRDRSAATAEVDVPTADLWRRLAARDAVRAAAIDPHNRRRILRMLDMLDTADAADIDATSGKTPFYENLVVIGLDMPRDALNARIAQRVDAMMTAGLEREARALWAAGVRGQAVAAIGYRELFRHFDGEIGLEAAVEAIKIHSRQYAKRQMTWFRNRMDATWFSVDPERPEATTGTILAWLSTLPGIGPNQ